MGSTVRHNCVHFCDEFARRLGVGRLPVIVRSLPDQGAILAQGGDRCGNVARSTFCCVPHPSANSNDAERVETIGVALEDGQCTNEFSSSLSGKYSSGIAQAHAYQPEQLVPSLKTDQYAVEHNCAPASGLQCKLL